MTHLDSFIFVLLTKLVLPFVCHFSLFIIFLRSSGKVVADVVRDGHVVTPVVLEHPHRSFFTFAVISGDGTAGFCQGGASAHSPES